MITPPKKHPPTQRPISVVTAALHDDKLSTAALVTRARAGGDDARAAFEVLARRYVGMVISLSRQQLGDLHAAEDAAQETLLLASNRLHQLEDASKFEPWLYAIAVRQARRVSRRMTALRPPAAAQHRPRPQDELKIERTEAVHNAIASLDEPYRVVVTLKFLEGLDAAEIARRLGVPHGTVRAQLSRALPLLRQKLENHL